MMIPSNTSIVKVFICIYAIFFGITQFVIHSSVVHSQQLELIAFADSSKKIMNSQLHPPSIASVIINAKKNKVKEPADMIRGLVLPNPNEEKHAKNKSTPAQEGEANRIAKQRKIVTEVVARTVDVNNGNNEGSNGTDKRSNTDADREKKKKEERVQNILDTVKPDTNEIADPSPKHLKISSRALERQKVCNASGMVDEISYAVIANIRRGIIETQRRASLALDIDQQPQENDRRGQVKKPRILCMVYTHEGAHKTNLQSIVDTWASQCDGFLAASNVTDVNLGAINIKFFGPEAYGNMWNKVEAMWKYAYKHYLDDYDYFHICGDDAYVIPDNLRAYLMGKQVNDLLNGYMDQFSIANGRVESWKNGRPRPLLLGFPISYHVRSYSYVFAAGGSGYTLNRAAVQHLYDTVMTDPSNITDSREDVLTSKNLAKTGITCSDTRDESGAFRYIPDNPVRDYRDPIKDNRVGHTWHEGKLRKIKPLVGLDAFSNETVAIHLNYKIGTKWLDKHVKYSEEMMYRYHDFFIGKCDEELLPSSRSPNATKMKYLAYIQGMARFKRSDTALNLIRSKIEESLGFPEGYLLDKSNM